MATEKRLIDMEDALRRMENAEHLMHKINGIKAVDIGALRQFFGMLKPVDAVEVVADYLLDNGVTFQRWISVTERLPNICEPVLVCFDFMGGKAVRASDRYGKNGVLWSGIPSNTNVTHWMPIPEPPREVE